MNLEQIEGRLDWICQQDEMEREAEVEMFHTTDEQFFSGAFLTTEEEADFLTWEDEQRTFALIQQLGVDVASGGLPIEVAAGSLPSVTWSRVALLFATELAVQRGVHP